MLSTPFHYPLNVVGTKHNGGFHPLGQRNYRKAVQTIMACLQYYREPRLYHLCFQGKTNKEHKSLLQALAQKLKRKGVPHEWFTAREIDSTKGEHLHIMMLLDAAGINTASILNGFEDQFLGAECLDRGIELHINKPQNTELHSLNRYIALPYQGPGNRETDLGRTRLKDGLEWLTYIYKARGKPTEDDRKANGQIFSASRPNRQRKTTTADCPDSITLPDRPIVIKKAMNSKVLH